MKTLCMLFLTALLLLLPPALSLNSSAMEEDPRSPGHSGSETVVELRVLWTISSFFLGEDAEWSEEEAQKMLFKSLDIDSSSITFDGKRCADLISRTDTVESAAYLSSKYNITPHIISYNHEMLQVVKTNCHIEGFSEYMRLRDRRIVISLHGVFYIFDPAVY